MQPLTVPGKLESLGAIAEFVQSAAVEAGLTKKGAYDLRLAVDEIVTNIIVHGYKEADLTGDLTVTAEVDDEHLTIALEDSAAAFDPTQTHTAARDALDQPLEERAVGGLGVYLALSSVDEFVYQRVGDRNRNIFIMQRPSAATQPTP
jgi:serine/threonine-protein kinase RsbW